jgi:hypothetical protein
MSRFFLSAGLLFAVVLLAAGCALRPRYGDVVPASAAGPQAHLLLVEKASGQPLAGVTVELGDGKTKVKRVTGPDGSFALPVDAALAQANPMLVVTLPAGVMGYAVHPAPPAGVEPPPAPVEAAPDGAGTSGPGGVSGNVVEPGEAAEVKPDEAPASEPAPAAEDGGSDPASL